jgi:hypothetical protein
MQKRFCPERHITGMNGASAEAAIVFTSGLTLRLLSFQMDPTVGSASFWMENLQQCIRAAAPKTEMIAQVSAC